ncbi:MAG: lipopolysaccharide biosynthesis protein [Limisphaerales bacterium]
MSADSGRNFFKQAGWLVIATVGSGVAMWSVHLFSKHPQLPPGEYGVFTTMLQLLYWMMIPSIGLGLIFTQQAAAVVDEAGRQQLAGAARMVSRAALGLWALACLALAVGQDHAVIALNLTSPGPLWVTLGAGLCLAWQPIWFGVLQGRQEFFRLGIVQILNGCGRVGGAALMFWGAGQVHATGLVTGALMGLGVSTALAAWWSSDLLRGPVVALEWRPWLRRLLPLTFGMGTTMFFLSADMVFVQSRFQDTTPGANTDAYGAAGTLARALVTFTSPLVSVMFPLLVRAGARGERNNVGGLTLGLTLAMSAGGALTLTLLSGFFLRLGFNPKFAAAAPLVPWFAWAMVPLTLTNVLVAQLFARERYAAAPWLALVAVAYAGGLWFGVPEFRAGGDHLAGFIRTTQIIAGFNMLLLATAIFFTWGRRESPKSKVQESNV